MAFLFRHPCYIARRHRARQDGLGLDPRHLAQDIRRGFQPHIERRDDDADRAVNCALAMQAAMHAINEQNRAEGLPEIETGIALNTGDVIAGNIGSERRSKYGFVGHPMNVTSRIEDLTAGGEILVSDSTLRSLQGNVRVGDCQELKVKGIEESIVVHRILGAEQ